MTHTRRWVYARPMEGRSNQRRLEGAEPRADVQGMFDRWLKNIILDLSEVDIEAMLVAAKPYHSLASNEPLRRPEIDPLRDTAGPHYQDPPSSPNHGRTLVGKLSCRTSAGVSDSLTSGSLY